MLPSPIPRDSEGACALDRYALQGFVLLYHNDRFQLSNDLHDTMAELPPILSPQDPNPDYDRASALRPNDRAIKRLPTRSIVG
jgi:hypothetical protein